MILPLDALLFAILLLTAVLSLRATHLVTSVMLVSAYSLFASLLFAGMLALDVALVEAALGAGLVGVMLLAALALTSSDGRATPDRTRRIVMVPVIAAFVGLMLYASTGLPDRGALDAPTRDGVSQTYLARSMQDTETPNVVAALLADYRSLDTLGEMVVILAAALGAALVLGRRPEQPTEPDPGPPSSETSSEPSSGEERP